MITFLVVAVLVLLGGVPAAADESCPSRTITIVNPYPPGGQADLSGRPFVAALAKVLKHPVIIANKPGAAGAVGMQSVAVAKPDGYTLLVTVPSLHTLPEVDKLFGREPTFTRDQFVPIARINADPLIVAVNAERPWKSVKEVLDDARKRPGQITFASAGLYGATHVPMEMLLYAAGGVKMRHLPTAGGGPATTAVLGGHADRSASTIGPANPHIKSGKIRALAVMTPKRSPELPDVPTLAEAGVTGVEMSTWYGLFITGGAPRDVQQRLYTETMKVLAMPDVRAKLQGLGGEPGSLTSAEFASMNKSDFDRFGKLVREAGIKSEQ